MHLKALCFSTLLFLLPIVRATSIAEINRANQALQVQTENNDADVKALTVANALLKSKVLLVFVTKRDPPPPLRHHPGRRQRPFRSRRRHRQGAKERSRNDRDRGQG